MSALGQKLPRSLTRGVSALPLKAAAALTDRRVRYGPIADYRTAANIGTKCTSEWSRSACNPHVDFIPKHGEINRFGQ
jgi:hypothetical protein